jgi:hypothetical protein
MQVSDAVMTEVTRARDAETSLQTLITNEITRAKINESFLASTLASIQGTFAL